VNAIVSIITPVYNSEKHLRGAINSVINQTYKHWELLLIDDGSTDQSVPLMNRYVEEANFNIKLIKNFKNEGTAVSRNKGIMEAQGDFIAFLDADDLWKPEKLEKQLKAMQRQNVEVCFSSYELISESGSALNKKICAMPVLNYKTLLKSNYIGNLTGIYNAKILGKVTSINLRKRQDWHLWLKALKISEKPAFGIQESLAYYRIRKGSISSNKFNLVKYNYLVYKKGLGYSTLGAFVRMLIFFKEQFLVKRKRNKKKI